jgi:hypothetical protein
VDGRQILEASLAPAQDEGATDAEIEKAEALADVAADINAVAEAAFLGADNKEPQPAVPAATPGQ